MNELYEAVKADNQESISSLLSQNPDLYYYSSASNRFKLNVLTFCLTKHKYDSARLIINHINCDSDYLFNALASCVSIKNADGVEFILENMSEQIKEDSKKWDREKLIIKSIDDIYLRTFYVLKKHWENEFLIKHDESSSYGGLVLNALHYAKHDLNGQTYYNKAHFEILENSSFEHIKEHLTFVIGNMNLSKEIFIKDSIPLINYFVQQNSIEELNEFFDIIQKKVISLSVPGLMVDIYETNKNVLIAPIQQRINYLTLDKKLPLIENKYKNIKKI